MREFKSVAELADCVGEEIGVSEWFSIDQDRINDFEDSSASFASSKKDSRTNLSIFLNSFF